MGLDLRLDTKMTQALVMTPRLQQAIKLLQYSHMEMVSHVEEQLLENPTLEVVPNTEDGGATNQELALRSDAEKVREDTVEQQNGSETNDMDWEKYLESMNDARPSPSSGGTIHDDLPPIETNLTSSESLVEHLMWQLHMTKCSEEEREAAEQIILNLDDRGYLILSLDEVRPEFEREVVQDALEMVQHFDPIGCGARSLSECLIIQASVHFPEDDTFRLILTEEHLHNFERRNYPAIARELGLDQEDVIEYHRMIQELEPIPGRGYASETPQYITPDLYVTQHGDEWYVLLNEEGLPDLRVSRYYQKVMKGASKQDKEYLLDKLRGAEFLIRSINKRRKTIRSVMESILKFQREFFEGGAERLRPMVLQDVADDVGVHMSTVSRVTTNKYVHTPHGIFELKYFFSSAVKQDIGEDVAAEAVKSRIRSLVQGEDRKHPLSDQQLADTLKKEGTSVARRTVAKYREALGILPSSQRKVMF